MKINKTYIFLSFEQPRTEPWNCREQFLSEFESLATKLYDCKGVYGGLSETSHCYVVNESGKQAEALKTLRALLTAYGQESALVVQGKESYLFYANYTVEDVPLGEYKEVFAAKGASVPMLYAYTEHEGRFFACGGN